MQVQTRILSHASETIDKGGVTIDFGKEGVEVEHEDLVKCCGGKVQFNESWNALIPRFCPESQRTDGLVEGMIRSADRESTETPTGSKIT